MPSWSELLFQARKATGLSRRALAERAGVSEESLASYEYGRPHPKLDHVRAIARALELGPRATEELVTSAGYQREPLSTELRALQRRRPAPESLAASVRDYPWPCFVLNERFEFTVWNGAATRVAERGFSALSPRERNLLRFAADPRFRARLQNWNEVVGHFMDLLAGDTASGPEGDAFNAHLLTVANEILVASPTVFNELMGLWLRATRRPDQRNIYCPIWQASDGTLLRFNTVVTTWSDFDALYANDWQPADAATWEWLGAHALEGASASPAATAEKSDNGGTGARLAAHELRRRSARLAARRRRRAELQSHPRPLERRPPRPRLGARLAPRRCCHLAVARRPRLKHHLIRGGQTTLHRCTIRVWQKASLCIPNAPRPNCARA